MSPKEFNYTVPMNPSTIPYYYLVHSPDATCHTVEVVFENKYYDKDSQFYTDDTKLECKQQKQGVLRYDTPPFIDDNKVPKDDYGLQHFFYDLRFVNLVKEDSELEWGHNSILMKFKEGLNLHGIQMFKSDGISGKEEYDTVVFDRMGDFVPGRSMQKAFNVDLFIHKHIHTGKYPTIDSTEKWFGIP